MPVSSISGAAHGDITDYRRDYSNQSAIARAGAIACHKVGGADEDIVLYGEATAGEVIGPILSTSKDPTLTDYLPTDGTGVCNASVAMRPGMANFILAANSGAVIPGDYLIPTGTVGAVMPRPAGSNVPPVGRSLQTIADSASERYCFAEVLSPGIGVTGQRISGFGADVPADDDYLVGYYANHVGTTPQHLFACPAAGIIRNLYVKSKTAPGGVLVVTYTVMKSSDGGATFSATALTCTITGTATEGADNTHAVAVAKGDILGIRVTSANVGTADESNANFIFE